jgi:hypothetical protein
MREVPSEAHEMCEVYEVLQMTVEIQELLHPRFLATYLVPEYVVLVKQELAVAR